MDSPPVLHQVIIVGGGVSGLFAALKLVENGHENVTVLEADDRFGGRVRSIPFQDGIIEMGAQWIHGRGECPLWRFVNDNQIEVATDGGGDGDGVFYLPGGQTMPHLLLQECLDFSENVHWYLNKHCHDKPPDQLPQSVGHFFEQQIEDFLAAEKDHEKLRLKRGFCDWFLKWELVDTGVDDLKNQSVRSWIDYIDYDLESEEGEPVLAGGYSSLVRFLVRSLEGRVQLRPGRRVVRIDWSGDGDHPVTVTTDTGQAYCSQYVVVGLPLGVLKSDHSSIFSPPLPRQKVDIIEQLHFGVMDKIFLAFDTIFWDSDNPGIQFIRTDLSSEVEGDVSQTWYHNIAGFDNVCSQPNVLCGWISGPPAVYMESLPDTEILERCWGLLKEYVGDWVPRPSRCLPTRWATNSHSRGSYSYSTPECDRRQIGPNHLASPLSSSSGIQRVFFCGEATEREHYGTVTGAMVSGLREGTRISNILQHRE